jgi:glycine/D-amino acid oxidase-like deaminating enzyme
MEIVVVGAGVFGAWTARHLVTTGATVTLVDAYGPANSKASSGDESRIIRCGYGPDEIYSQWARDSLVQWREAIDRLESRNAPLFHACGVLWIGGDDAYAAATYETLRRGGYSVERLAAAELRARFPQIQIDDIDVALFEPDCGVLMARRTVQALVVSLEAAGMRLLRGHVAAPIGGGRVQSVRMTSGDEISADAFVFACGPWLPVVLPSLLGSRIRPTRQVVMYFGSPPGDARFGPATTPAWIDFAAGIYGVPDLEHRGVKVGIDRHGPPFDPDRDDRLADVASVETARAWLARRMPALAKAPVTETRVCQYENTDTGDFLIDRHPDFDNVWIVGGGSGHGFKHGPAVGKYVAGLVRGSVRHEPRFALSARGISPHRSVY